MGGTWTYTLSTTSPTLSSKDQVRLLTGQTSSQDQALLYDQEINWFLTQAGGVYFASAMAAEDLGTKYAALAMTRKVGELAVGYGDRAAYYRAQAKMLRRQGMTRGVQVYVGGQLVAEQVSDNQDTSRTQPPFQIGMNDNPPLYRGVSS